MGTLSIELRWAIHPGFYGKLFLHSGILKEHFIDAGVIDADFRGIIQVLILNHHPEKTFTVRTEDRIAQVVFIETFNAKFHRVSKVLLLGSTKRLAMTNSSTFLKKKDTKIVPVQVFK